MSTPNEQTATQPPFVGASGSAIPPLRREWTREQLQEAAKIWMKANASGYTREGYYTSLGLLIDFVTDLFDGLNVELPNAPRSATGANNTGDKQHE